MNGLHSVVSLICSARRKAPVFIEINDTPGTFQYVSPDINKRIRDLLQSNHIDHLFSSNPPSGDLILVRLGVQVYY